MYVVSLDLTVSLKMKILKKLQQTSHHIGAQGHNSIHI